MKVISDDIIYHDNRHNAFTSMVYWKDKYWLAFRNGDNHRSDDGKIMLINSPDLKTWSAPQIIIDSPMDDRDPTIYVCNDQLFVVSMSIDREYKDKNDPFGGIKVHNNSISLMSSSRDGQSWSEPKQILPDYHVLWWTESVGQNVYASVQIHSPADIEVCNYHTELWKSHDGQEWEKISVISDQDNATEVALTFLPDKRLVAFVRHEGHAPDNNNKPEIKIAHPPYQKWETLMRFNFWHNGPCIGQVNGKIVTSSRAFFDFPGTPLTDACCRERLRGMILGILDPDKPEWTPSLAIPHHHGPRGDSDPDAHEDASMNWPDISYASIMDLNNGRFAMSYYEGYKGPPSDIRMAILQL